MRATFAERFWSKVERTPSGCWEWQGYRTRAGYGQVAQESLRAGRLIAHRVAWALHHQVDPGDLFVCHKCDNPPCCNPHHLYAGTVRDNARDASERGRIPGSRVGGERHYRTRLTETQVCELRTLRSEGWLLRDLAERYGISVSSVSSIATGRTWKQNDKQMGVCA